MTIAWPLGLAAHTHASDDKATASEKAALATEYLKLTHFDERCRDSLSKGLRLSWRFCKDSRCQADLDHDIDVAVASRIPMLESKYSNELASRLSKENLVAALEFLKTPNGQAFNKAATDMNDDMISENHAIEMAIYVDLSKVFCSQHQDLCTKQPAAVR